MNRIQCMLIIGVLSVSSSGCVAPRNAPMYYIGNSDSALYASKKEPTEENCRKLKESLEDVIERSQKEGVKVPPGMFAHLGYLNLLENKTDEATKYFTHEKQLYPEATVFMDRMINKVEEKTQEVEGVKKDA